MDKKISNLAEIASVRRYRMVGGKADGLEVLDCDNGKIRFLVNLSHGLDVMQLYHGGQNMSFVSKNGFVKENRDFLSRFEGGMVYTCGLDSVGGRDGFVLHGNYHTLPGELEVCRCDEKEIEIVGTVRQSSLFGDNLCLRRRIYAKAGEGSLTLTDTLTNEGAKEAKYALLYHVNSGYPMLDAGCRVECEALSVKPRGERAERYLSDAFNIIEPLSDGEEECFFLELVEPKISLVNERLGKKFTLEYSGKALPKFVLWRSMVANDYALGFEPATTELDDGFEYRTLSPTETKEFSVKLSFEEI